MFIATIVIMMCSIGPGNCGNDMPDSARPQDLAIVRALKACEHAEMKTEMSMAEIKSSCDKKVGIQIETPKSYNGPLVYVDTGKPATILSSPPPRVYANDPEMFALWKATFLSLPVVRCFPALISGVFVRHGEAYQEPGVEPHPIVISDTTMARVVPDPNIFEEPTFLSNFPAYRYPIDKGVKDARKLDILYDDLGPAGDAKHLAESGYLLFWVFDGLESSAAGVISATIPFKTFMSLPSSYRSGNEFIARLAADHYNGGTSERFKVHNCGMTEMLFVTATSGASTSLLLILDDAGRIVAAREDAGA